MSWDWNLAERHILLRGWRRYKHSSSGTGAQEGGADVFWTGQVNHLNYQAFRVNGKENIQMIRGKDFKSCERNLTMYPRGTLTILYLGFMHHAGSQVEENLTWMLL